MPTPRFHGATAVLGTKMYMFSGISTDGSKTKSPIIEVYDTKAQQWDRQTFKMPKNSPEDDFGAAGVNGKIYLFGGRRGAIKGLMVFDPVEGNDQWKMFDAGPMSEFGIQPMEFATCVLGNLIYAMGIFEGGKTKEDHNYGYRDVIVYDTVNKKWSEGPPTVRGRGVAMCAVGPSF